MKKPLFLILAAMLGGYIGMGYMDYYEHVKKMEFLHELILQDKLIEMKDHQARSQVDSKLTV
jgi:hypothetical protein